MAENTKESEEKLGQLQMLEQNLQSFLLQKRNFQTQLVEIESALSEIENTPSAYKIIGNIMVAADKEILKKDLGQKKEMLDLKIKTLEKQEEKLKEQVTSTQQDVMKDLKKK